MSDIISPPGEASAGPADNAPVTQPPTRLAELIDAWWHDHFPGSPVAQVTAAWNHAFAAMEALKRRLNDLNPGE